MPNAPKAAVSRKSIPVKGLSLEQQDRLLVELSNQEQGWFWSRFAAFSAMHAGLLVLFAVDTSNPASAEAHDVIALAGLALALAWIYVQIISLWYVGRFKIGLRDLMLRAGLWRKRPAYFPLSSTQTGTMVAILIGLLWSYLVATI